MTSPLLRFVLLAMLVAPSPVAAQRLADWRSVLWYNDAGGLTIGARVRGATRAETMRHTLVLGWSTGIGSPDSLRVRTPQFALSLRDPFPIAGSDVEQHVTLERLDGRSRVALSLSRPDQFGASLRWLAVHDDRFLDAARWDVGGTLELPLWLARRGEVHGWRITSQVGVTGAVEYRRPGGGITTEQRYDLQPWAKGDITLSAARMIRGIELSIRARHAGIVAADPILPQRRLFVAGADPYEEGDNPLVRSVGAPLVRGEMAGHWHTAGGANLRGFDRTLSTDRITSVNIELRREVVTSSRPLLSSLSVVTFADAAWLGAARGVGGDVESLALRAPVKELLVDGGVGIRAKHTLFGLTFESRVDFPIYVNDSPWAASAPRERLSLSRWLVGITPVIP